MIQELLGGETKNIISAIASKVGSSDAQASGFLDQALSMIEGLRSSGKLDVNSLLKGDLSALTSTLGLGSLGSLLGGGEDKAEQGLGALIGPLKDKLAGQSDLAGMLGNLTGGNEGGSGGGLGDALGKLGGMFGKN